MAYDYNLAVIGAGSAGLTASYLASALQAKVVLIEAHKMGGDCLNTGCVPSKAMLASAKIIGLFKKHQQFGLEDLNYKVNFAQVMQQVQQTIQQIAPHDSVERYTQLGVKCISGKAKLLSAHEIEVQNQTISAKNIILAGGSRPSIPPIEGLTDMQPLHSDNLWELRDLPKSLLCIGGGPIGCEIAQCFSRFGTKVTILDIVDQILPKEDPDIAELLLRVFKQDGIEFEGRVNIQKFTKSKQTKTVHYTRGGATKTLNFDQLFLATGRVPNTEGLGIEHLGIQLNPNKTICTDAYLRTSQKNIFACGDIAGPFQFTHTASYQAQCCTLTALFAPFKKFAPSYRAVPWVTYTDPEIAQVGLNETALKAKNQPYQVSQYSLENLDRAIADRQNYGKVKLFTEPKKGRILGATICSSQAGNMIQEFTLAMQHNLSVNDILNTIHPYPTFSEANRFVAGEWKRNQTPKQALFWLKWWNRLKK